MSTAAPPKTVIQRCSLCRPIALALHDGLLSTKTTFFDYGFGRIADLKPLHQMGVPVSACDPTCFPHEDRTPASPFEDTRPSSLTPFRTASRPLTPHVQPLSRHATSRLRSALLQ